MADKPSSGNNETRWEHAAQALAQGATASHQAAWPFPFFGAGAATYYEWAEVVIRLKQPPTEEQLAYIKQTAPPPLKSSPVECNGKMLLAGGGQFVNVDIERAYGAAGDEESQWDDDEDDDDDDDDDDDPDDPSLYASDEALARFNQAIERWLLEIHGVCPIEFAFRREDHEAEGTDFSEWHTASVAMAPALIATWNDDPMTYEQSTAEKRLFAYAVAGIRSYAGIATLPDRFSRFLSPEK